LAATQNIDTDENNPSARFLLHVFAAVAELEREMIRERVVAGIKTAKIKGKSIGRPQRVFRRDEAIALRANGMSWRGIGRHLGVPMSTVMDACNRGAAHTSH
jgi:DNA invertase Pin-like site-specific DNA recombinase